MKDVEEALPGKQLTKKVKAAGGAVEAKSKFQTPVEDRRAAEERHRKVAAVLSELERYHVTAPEASIEAALDANNDSPTAAARWLITDPSRRERLSVRPVERA